MKQKVFIVLRFPNDSEEARVEKVFNTLIGADTYRKRDRCDKTSLFIIKKSVQGTKELGIRDSKGNYLRSYSNYIRSHSGEKPNGNRKKL